MAKAGFATNPTPASCRLLDFDRADVVPGIVPNTFFLIVRGTTPCINMEVTLTPMIYVACPEFWGIEVIGCLPTGICLDAIGHYEKTIPLNGITGSQGIEIIGASKREKRKVPGGCHSTVDFAKDGPFAKRDGPLAKDGPFPMSEKDGPFPMSKDTPFPMKSGPKKSGKSK